MTTLFDDGTRQWLFFGRDPERPASVIDTNEYVVRHDGKALLLDPGGTEVFPEVAEAMARQFDLGEIEAIFGSHQDPDILSSLPLWIGLRPDVRVYVPWLWQGFLSHFAIEAQFVAVPDEGGPLPLNGSRDLQMVPAHYVHSSGMFSVYDPRARLLFSADVGAALLPADDDRVFVEDFDAHVGHMEAFHRRWMPSNRAKNAWIRRVRRLDVDLMCPQHGAIFRGDDVTRFLDWFEALEVGIAAEVGLDATPPAQRATVAPPAQRATVPR
ncbi:MAG TPA: MBL fold metallo-hydrolase [Acidimicrobiales bacterium]|nr:MBL fold metallo-hydrolase [Acidimicrobiales bacterium]